MRTLARSLAAGCAAEYIQKSVFELAISHGFSAVFSTLGGNDLNFNSRACALPCDGNLTAFCCR
jgi:hypothetical protein